MLVVSAAKVVSQDGLKFSWFLGVEPMSCSADFGEACVREKVFDFRAVFRKDIVAL